MTQEQLEDLINLSAPLLDNPKPWNQLTLEQQEAFQVLMPNPNFTNEQREWIKLWWLPVTEQQLEDINNLLPPNNVVTSRQDINGGFFISVDLLSDALNNGRLAAILPVLVTLPLTYKLEEEWPIIEDSEL